MQIKHKNIIAITVMISFLLILGLIQTGVQAKISVSDAYEIKKSNEENSEKWQNTDKVGDEYTHNYSSYDDSNALIVDPSYGFKVQKTSKTKTEIVQGTEMTGSSESGEIESSETYPAFKTSQNAAGKIKVKVTNCSIWQCDTNGKNGHSVNVDVLKTITAYDLASEDGNGKKEGYIKFRPGLNGVSYAGTIEELTMKTQFFKAGTETPVTLRTNVTLKDVDNDQYIGIKASKVDGQYVAKDTNLLYKKSGSMDVYASPTGNVASTPESAVGFIFESNNFEYTFGRNIAKPTGENQYAGTGQNMVKFPPTNPVKTVSDNDETDTTSNHLRSLAETFTYKICQNIPTDIPEAHYYKSFVMEDTIEECLKVNKVEVTAVNTDGKEINVSSMFTIKQDGQKITATLKDPKNAKFYTYGSYNLKITVKINIPENWTVEQKASLEKKWEEHGHYASANSSLLFANTAKTIIDGKDLTTNRVTTTVELPKRTDSFVGLDVTKVVDKYEYKVGDTVSYTVTASQKNSMADTAYFYINDLTLPEGMVLDFTSVKVTGIDAANYTLTQSGNGWILKSKGDYALPQASTITVKYNATAAEGANGNEVINRAKAAAIGVPEKEADAKVWINSPNLKITKKADKEKYKVGDTVTYTVDVSQDAIGCVARNIVLKDVLKTDGVKLQKNSVVVMDADGNVLKDVDVVVKNNDFDITTHKNLVCPTDKYSVYDGKLIKQDKLNPLNLTKETAFKIEYQAVITDEKLSGQDVTNVATVNSDENIPKEDEEVVPIQGPNLDITKTSDAGVYKVGDIGKYTLTAKQTREGETAKNVVIKDKFGIEGVEIDKDSFVVKFNGEIIEPVKIETTADGFTVETGKDLTDADKLEVTYQVLFKEASLENQQVPNKAAVSADNAPEKETDHEVTIKTADDPVLKILKESDKKEYFLGEIGKYSLTITQERLDAVAKNVVIEDTFDQKGMVIDPASLKVTVSGKDITAQCKLEVEDNKYTINTNADLAREVMKITYDVLFKEEALKDKDVINTAKAKADNSEEVQTQNTIKISKKDTRFAVKKDAKDKDYQTGDLIPYSIKVNLTKPGDTAKNITIKDTLPEGLELKKDTIKVSGVEKYEIKVTGNVLTVQINQMVYGQKAVITYQAKILKGTEGKSLTNKVEVTSDDTVPANAKKTIKIPKPSVGSKIAKTLDKAKPGLLVAVIAAGTAGLIWLYRKKKQNKS